MNTKRDPMEVLNQMMDFIPDAYTPALGNLLKTLRDPKASPEDWHKWRFINEFMHSITGPELKPDSPDWAYEVVSILTEVSVGILRDQARMREIWVYTPDPSRGQHKLNLYESYCRYCGWIPGKMDFAKPIFERMDRVTVIRSTQIAALAFAMIDTMYLMGLDLTHGVK